MERESFKEALRSCYSRKKKELDEIMLRAALYFFIIKFRYNARSDWLKERALSEYGARRDKGGPNSVFASAF